MIASKRRLWAPIALVVATWAPGALAAGEDDKAAAEALFHQGKTLLAEGEIGEACGKFEESLRLDYGMGAQFQLASCYERLGKLASAWSAYLEVAARAKRDGDAAREEVAREHAAAIEPQLSRLRIVVTSPLERLEVLRGETLVGNAQWGMTVPVDAGRYPIVARAEGYAPFETTIEVGHGGSYTVTIPELDPLPAEPQPLVGGSTVDASDDGLAPTEIAAIVAAGVGVAGIAVGSVTGIMSMSSASSSEDHCDGDLCDAEGVELRDDALVAGDISTVGFIIGGVGLAAGAALWFSTPLWEDGGQTVGVNVGMGSIRVNGSF